VGKAGVTGVFVGKAGEYGVSVEYAGTAGVRAKGGKHGGIFINDTAGPDFPALYVENQSGNTANHRIANFYAGGQIEFYFQGDGYAYAKGGWNTFKEKVKGEYV